MLERQFYALKVNLLKRAGTEIGCPPKTIQVDKPVMKRDSSLSTTQRGRIPSDWLIDSTDDVIAQPESTEPKKEI